MMKLSLIVCILLSVTVAVNSIKTPSSCPGQLNSYPVIQAEPQLAGEMTYHGSTGKKFTFDYDGRNFTILNVTGDPYNIGFIEGTLLKEELNVMIPKFYIFLESYVKNISFLSKLPGSFKNAFGAVVLRGFQYMLDVSWEITKPFTPDRFNAEIQGMSDASGVSVQDIRGLNMVPELLKAWCSLLGAWSNSTYSKNLIQFRALDWDAAAPIAQFPLITVYHIDEQGSLPFSNIGWPGFVGSLTGYSPYIGVGEKLRSWSGNNTSRFGKPWTYALRDTLQFSSNIDQALDSLNNTARTCNVWLGVGSYVNNTFRLIKYAAQQFDVIDSSNWGGQPATGDVEFTAYQNGQCFTDILEADYGYIDAESIMHISQGAKTGDSMAVVMDFKANTLHVAFPSFPQGEPGYSRPFASIDMNQFMTRNE